MRLGMNPAARGKLGTRAGFDPAARRFSPIFSARHLPGACALTLSPPAPMPWDSGRWDLGRWDSAGINHHKNKRKKRMKHQQYYPSRITAQVAWLTNFRDKLPGYATVLGFTTGQITAIVGDANWLIYVLGSWLGAVRAWSPSTTDYVKDIQMGDGEPVLPVFTAPPVPAGVASVPAGALLRVFDFVQDIKEAAGYTEQIGSDLGVVGSEDAADHPTPKFLLKIEQGSSCQCVRITFYKYGHMGVYIECRRGGSSAEWEFLTIDTESPYDDARPLLVAGQPEVREYRMRYWDKGTPNGDWTAIEKITVAP